MRDRKKLLFWIGGIVILVIVISGFIWFLTAPPGVKMIYYASSFKKVVEYQTLHMTLVKRYGKDVAIVHQYFEGPLSYVPEVWFLDGKLLGAWVITPKKPTHLVVNFSREFIEDIQRHPLLVQRWIEGLFQTLRENGRPIEKCSFLVEGSYQKVVIGRWNLFYPVPVKTEIKKKN
ncbi:MAG: hypothetical protein ACK4HQ_06815 [Brevinematales bacterium]